MRALPSLLLALVLLAGCTTKLAPDYDPTIVDGLTRANEHALTLFATVSAGTTSASYASRAGSYDSVIGMFDAIRVEATARPAPPPPALPPPTSAAANPKAPTADIAKTIVTTLTRMRDDDRASGLNPIKVDVFKGSYEISIEQALAYEKALQR